jgi:TPP-dependent pyruvate/acetoin dehydrogenase alpha subunit
MATPEQEKIAQEILRLRISQMLVNEAYKAGKFKVPIHLALGHEAIAVAVSATMQPGDALLPSHRNIAYNLARAGALKPILDEYLMKPTGLNGGRSGSMNLLNPEKGIVYTSSILGNQFPVAPGVAMVAKMAGKKNVAIVMAGDGSMEEGSFYEAMLMARSMEVPVLFMVENNEWSMSTRIDQRRTPIDVSLLAESLDIRYISLEGNDVYRYSDDLRDARQFALDGNVPVCIEVKVATLGDWKMKTAEFPEGEFINYHAGPAPEVAIGGVPIIRESEDDPVYILSKYIDRATLETLAQTQLEALQAEIA